MVFRDVIQDQAAELIAKNAAEYTKYQERRFCKRFHLRYPINSLSENLSETCDQYEKFDFGSEEYQEMWKENFLAADDSCKQSAALYVQGSITNKSKDSDYTKLSSVVSSNNPLVKSTLKRNHESSRRCSTYPIISKHKEGARMEIEGPIELLNDDDEIFNRQDKDEQCLGAHRSSAPKRLKLQNCTVKSLKAIRADVELVGNVSLQSTQGIAREPRLTELARLSQMRLKKRQAYGKTFNSSTTKTEKELFSDDFLRKRRSRVTLSINKPERQGSKGGANDRPMSREEAISLAEKNLCKLEARFNSEVSELLAELNSSTLIMTGLSKDRESLELKHLRSSEIKARSEDGWELQLILIKVLQLVKIRGAIMDTREVRHQLLS